MPPRDTFHGDTWLGRLSPTEAGPTADGWHRAPQAQVSRRTRIGFRISLTSIFPLETVTAGRYA